MSNNYYLNNKPDEYLVSIIEANNIKKIIVVRGKNSYKISGAEKFINKCLRETRSEVAYYYDFEDNPKDFDLDRGLTLLRRFNPDLIIGIGGGSVLDMAKLMRYYYDTKIPLVAIPTTAGTGSEVTHFAVLYKNGVKHSIAGEKMLPNYAIVNYKFTLNNPKYLTACTGFDALAQAIESFWNKNATEESDKYALQAIELLWPNLFNAVNNPSEDSRKKVVEGSFWAGKAINITKTTAPHACSYPFTIHYGLPHGHAVALTFPFWFEFNISKRGNLQASIKEKRYYQKIDLLLNSIGAIGMHQNIINYVLNYINSIGLKSLDTSTLDKDVLVHNINIDRLSNNPKVVTEEVLKDLLDFL